MAQVDVAGAGGGDSKAPGHVMDLLKQHDFLSISLGGKIHCSLTNRDLPLRVDAVQQHLNSKKLKKEREWYNADYSKYEPLIVPHKTSPKMLYCTLTNAELNRIPKQIEAHVKGKRFLNRKAEMEGLKQAQRQPAAAASDDEFWAPTGGAKADAMEEESDDDEREDGEDEEEEEEEGSDEGKSRPRGGKRKTGGRESTTREKKSRGDKGGNAKAHAKASTPREAKGSDQANGVSPGDKSGESKKRDKSHGRTGKKGKRNSQATAGEPSTQPKARKCNAAPLSEDTPAVSIATKGAKKAGDGKPQRSPKGNGRGKGKGGATPKGDGDTAAIAASGAKRKHKVSSEPASDRKKKRKA